MGDLKQRIDSTTILEELLLFDVWLLLKAQWIADQILKWIIPMLKISLFMGLGVVLLLMYACSHAKFDIANQKDFVYKDNSLMVSKYLQLDDNSKPQSFVSSKELLKVKNEMIILEKQLQRMKLHLKDVYKRNSDKELADFASEAVGGLVIDTPDTKSYSDTKSTQLTILGMPVWKSNYYTPRKVIQSWTQPGECWAFEGSFGKVKIQLAHTAIIESVTLEHILPSASITGKINSAPKTFNVLGEVQGQYVMIDTFMYNKDKGQCSQTFKIKNQEMKAIPFKRVILEILSNWGNPDYTCIYRFKVHGRMYEAAEVEASIIQ